MYAGVPRIAPDCVIERHGTVERDLSGLVDDPHATAAQLTADLVVAEVAHRRAGGQAVAVTPRVAEAVAEGRGLESTGNAARGKVGRHVVVRDAGRRRRLPLGPTGRLGRLGDAGAVGGAGGIRGEGAIDVGIA